MLSNPHYGSMDDSLLGIMALGLVGCMVLIAFGHVLTAASHARARITRASAYARKSEAEAAALEADAGLEPESQGGNTADVLISSIIEGAARAESKRKEGAGVTSDSDKIE